MMKRKTRRLAAAGIAVGAIGGLGAGVLGTGAAQASHAEIDRSGNGGGLASMSSPFIPGVEHVAADVLLHLDPDGGPEGASYEGPAGSKWNGPADRVETDGDGLAAMSSPYLPGVMHLPAAVGLALGPGGSLEGARYLAREGSIFDGPVAEVDARAQAFWDEQVAAGATPEQADRRLAGLVDRDNAE